MPDTHPPCLNVSKVSVGYNGASVVEGLDFSIGKNETFGLIGANGAGKTTFIKTMLGLRSQLAGDLSVFGCAPGDPQASKRLCYLPERFDPPWFLSGAGFLKFSLSLYGRKVEESAVFAAAERLDLDPAVLSRRVQTYSKGMRQKLGLLSCFLSGCEFLVLDEPMSGLDPLARVRVKEMIQDAGKQGVSVFLSSHILADMEEICERVVMVHDGQVVALGTPKDILKTSKCDTLERAFLHFVGKTRAA